jgi:GNAT superfamily N-acetyltransferase
MSTFTVRPAAASDVPTITAFNIAMALETEELALDAGTVAAGVSAAVGDPARALYFVALPSPSPSPATFAASPSPSVSPATVAACCMVTFEWSDWRNSTVWWLQSVYCDPAHRGQGAFRALWEAVEGGARAAGAAGLRLYAEDSNESAHAVYRRLGMKDDHYRVFEKMW